MLRQLLYELFPKLQLPDWDLLLLLKFAPRTADGRHCPLLYQCLERDRLVLQVTSQASSPSARDAAVVDWYSSKQAVGSVLARAGSAAQRGEPRR